MSLRADHGIGDEEPRTGKRVAKSSLDRCGLQISVCEGDSGGADVGARGREQRRQQRFVLTAGLNFVRDVRDRPHRRQHSLHCDVGPIG